MSGSLSAPEAGEDVRDFERELGRSLRIQLLVPSVTPGGRELPLQRWTRHALGFVLPMSGGATEIPAVGHWVDPRGRVVTESVRILDVYLPRRLTPVECAALSSELIELAALMEQDGLGVVVGDRFHVVGPTGFTPAQALDER